MSRLAHMEQASNSTHIQRSLGQYVGLRPRTVDFYLYSAHEIAVWEPIWRALRRRGVDAQFILEPPGVHPALGSVPDPENDWFDDKDGPVEPLVNDETYLEIRHTLHSLGFTPLDRSRIDADAVITTQGVSWLVQYRDALRIKTEYGAKAFAGVYSHGAINRGHDIVLAHGAFSKSAIGIQVPPYSIRVVGFPKWAPTIRARTTAEEARHLLGIDSTLPILAWLPTWAHNSGIDRYSDALAQLAERYLVVAKPHHNNLRFEADRLKAIDQRIQVRSDLHSLVPLLIASDVAVVDSRSGALGETILANRPAVGLLPGVDAREHRVIEGLGDAVVWCQQPQHLLDAVDDALATDRSEARGRWREWLFADFDGRDDEVATDVIIEAIGNRAQGPESSNPLESVDVMVEATDHHDPDAALSTVDAAWPSWPAHPSLLNLIERATPAISALGLLALSRLVRTAGLHNNCPLIVAAHRPDGDPVARLASAALAAIELEDDDAAQLFHQLVPSIPEDRFDEVFFELDLVPAAIPVFVQVAATTPSRCRMLARELNRLGAPDEAEAVTAFGESLVSP